MCNWFYCHISPLTTNTPFSTTGLVKPFHPVKKLFPHLPKSPKIYTLIPQKSSPRQNPNTGEKMRTKNIAGAIAIAGFLFLISCQKQKTETAVSTSTQIPNSAQEICPILVGDTIPNLTLHTQDGFPFDLKKAVQSKPTVLIFFRGGW